jgi:hypothetical protein
MAFLIHPSRRFPVLCVVTYNAGPFQVQGFLLKLRGETPLLLAYDAPPFADYARKVSTKSGGDQSCLEAEVPIIFPNTVVPTSCSLRINSFVLFENRGCL